MRKILKNETHLDFDLLSEMHCSILKCDGNISSKKFQGNVVAKNHSGCKLKSGWKATYEN